MKSAKIMLLGVALSAIALLGVGLYLQFMRDMAPCPLCILQRYAFVAVALCCGITFALPAASLDSAIVRPAPAPRLPHWRL